MDEEGSAERRGKQSPLIDPNAESRIVPSGSGLCALCDICNVAPGRDKVRLSFDGSDAVLGFEGFWSRDV